MYYMSCIFFFFFKQKTAYEMRISDWSSDVCSSDLKNFYADIINKKQITLKYDENYFKVGFSAINYIHNEKCIYKYQLAGFDNNWLYTDGQNNSATYSNIPPGSYKFIVLSSNEDGYWSSVETSFDIKVLPPLWKSDIAWLLYIIITGAIGYLIFVILKKRSEFKKAILIEKLKHEKDEEVYNSKIQFFTNITHEFCTPLTLITSPAEKLYHYKHADSYIKEKSTIIQDNAKRLLRLFQELLDFRKIEDNERSEEHTSELQSLMRISYAVFCLKKTKT